MAELFEFETSFSRCYDWWAESGRIAVAPAREVGVFPRAIRVDRGNESMKLRLRIRLKSGWALLHATAMTRYAICRVTRRLLRDHYLNALIFAALHTHARATRGTPVLSNQVTM
jgi:hypothetical protein